MTEKMTDEQKEKYAQDRAKISALFSSPAAIQRREQARSKRIESTDSIQQTSRRDGEQISNDFRKPIDTEHNARLDNGDSSIDSRVAKLEIRVFELWNLLTEKSIQTGKPKLTKTGRNIIEMLKGRQH